MPERDGHALQTTSIKDAVAAEPARERAIRAAALIDALKGATFPIECSAGAVSIAVREVAAAHGGNAVSFHMEAAIDGKPIPGWDPNIVVVNPPSNHEADGGVREDIVAAILADLVDHVATEVARRRR